MREANIQGCTVELVKRELDQLLVKRQELSEIDARIHILQTFLSQAGFPQTEEVASSAANMGSMAGPSSKRRSEVMPLRPKKKRDAFPYHLQAKRAMDEAGKSRMQLDELLNGFANRKWRVWGKSAKETLRASLKRKPDVFRDLNDGAFELVGKGESAMTG